MTTIIQSVRFKKAYKKLHSNQLPEVNKAINDIIENPDIGVQKTVNLSWLRVYKFKVLKQLTLLGYTVHKNGDVILTMIDLGSHENFYRDISR
ncbi:MAG: type II toxin-antitoxin system RelE/ParE family toxin [Alphaproteobacteria bacterium]|nr:type II toxin-antitoxin system RelE/ParE family toxin [Alphaproteobacteria bacterium]MCL2505638.1 type II toxin-antitoxin system RelE/ParE family toxin [Alphaproteobacteria bacterium]